MLFVVVFAKTNSLVIGWFKPQQTVKKLFSEWTCNLLFVLSPVIFIIIITVTTASHDFWIFLSADVSMRHSDQEVGLFFGVEFRFQLVRHQPHKFPVIEENPWTAPMVIHVVGHGTAAKKPRICFDWWYCPTFYCSIFSFPILQVILDLRDWTGFLCLTFFFSFTIVHQCNGRWRMSLRNDGLMKFQPRSASCSVCLY